VVPCTGTSPRSIAAEKRSGPAHSVEDSPPSRTSERITPPLAISARSRIARYTLDLPLPLAPVTTVRRPSGTVSWRSER
jgi:hypothetical protein